MFYDILNLPHRLIAVIVCVFALAKMQALFGIL